MREDEAHVRLLRDFKADGDALVVRLHAQQARDQRAVGTVAVSRRGEGAGKRDPREPWRAFAKKPARHAADAHRARRMRGAGADHHRAENIEQIHLEIPFILWFESGADSSFMLKR